MKLTRREFVNLGLAAGASLVLPKLARADNPPSILWIGWDGADYRTVSALLREGRLPNLANLNTVRLDAVGATVTKPGWVEIITGYEYPQTEVFDNKWDKYPPSLCLDARIEACNGDSCFCPYAEVPLGYILFYRIKTQIPNYWCGCIFSKANMTSDADNQPWAPLRRWYDDGDGPLDYYENASNGGDGDHNFTIEETNGWLFDHALANFTHPGLMFCHYSCPDSFYGHGYGMDSPQYLRKISKPLDAALGKAIATMNPDIVIVCSDHGFNGPGLHQHRDAPNGFISSNLPLANNCVRRDVGYTVSKLLGLWTYPPAPRGKDMRKV